MAFQQEDITEEMKNAIARIKDLVQAGRVTAEARRPGGWRYGGTELEAEVKLIREIIGEERKVLGCNVFHFVNDADIRNRTKRLVIIPVNGTLKLDSGECLSPGHYYFTEECHFLFGEKCDVIMASMEKLNAP